jgi:hypothetical protein
VPGATDRVQHRLIGNGFKLDIATVGELRIDGKEVVRPVDLDPVAGEVDERPIGVVGLVAECLQRLHHASVVEVSHNEAEFTSKEQCAAGAQVLLQAVLAYDWTPGGGGGRRTRAILIIAERGAGRGKLNFCSRCYRRASAVSVTTSAETEKPYARYPGTRHNRV